MRLLLHELRDEMRLYCAEPRARVLHLPAADDPLPAARLRLRRHDRSRASGLDYLLTGTLGYGVVATAFAGLAIMLVIRREEGILKRLRSTPLPAPVYLLAVLTTTMAAFLVQAAAIIALGMAVFGASFPDNLVSLVVALVLGAAVFAALGVGLTGLVRRAEGASAVVNAIYFPMLFLSGSFFERSTLPAFPARRGRRPASDVLHRPRVRSHERGRPDLGPARRCCRPGGLGPHRKRFCGAAIPVGPARGLASCKGGRREAWGLTSR